MEKPQIRICLGSSCFSRGNKANMEVIKKYLKEKNLDANIEFKGHLCEGKCDKGPVISIDNRLYEEVKMSRLYKILQEEFPC